MWIADNWKDYELIDTADGERLERWGTKTLHIQLKFFLYFLGT